MISYRCDGCGQELEKTALRYSVQIDVRATYEESHVGLLELVRDHRKELLSLIEGLKDKSAQEIEETVYKAIKLDLCPSCQRAFIRQPLRFHPEQGVAEESINIDDFLRTLGYGKSTEDTGD